jgi:acetyl-CoA acetyltransferase
MAVRLGLATYVACLCGLSFSRLGMMGGAGDAEGAREGGGSHGEVPHYGITSPAAGAALSAQRYFVRYGASSRDLAAIPVAFRKHAQLNPNAQMRQPMTIDDHQQSPLIMEPLRLFDYCPLTDGGVCIIVTTAERARDGKKSPVYLMGMQGLRGGRQEFSFGLPGLGVAHQDEFVYAQDDTPVYDMAGITRADVDALYVYDGFSPNVWFALERFGFCPVGEAWQWTQGGRIELGGELPVNTAGGLLSEGHLSCWNHIAEITRQLRGECGARQVQHAEVLQWATCFGDSVIFRR